MKKIIISSFLGVLIVLSCSFPFWYDYVLANKQDDFINNFEKNLIINKRVDKSIELFNDKHNKKKNNTTDVARNSLETIAVLSIPKIHEILPVFDNTSKDALDNGVGLLEGSSKPNSGKDTHSVLTGHRGLSIGRLFTDLPKLKKNDIFYLKTKEGIKKYRVDRVLTVEPDDTSHFEKVKGKEYVSLVTCTPLFVNSHRLLVRGVNVPYTDKDRFDDTGLLLTPLAKLILVLLGSSVIVVGSTVFFLKKRGGEDE